MTWRLIGPIWRLENMTSMQRLVLLALASFTDQNGGNAYPSQSTLARMACCSRSTVKRALAKNGGPQRIFLAIGYAAWGPGQLEWEIRSESWVSVYSGDALVFDDDMASKWQRAFDKRGRNL